MSCVTTFRIGTVCLPAYRIAAIGRQPRGAVLVHGGFDSLIEEFFAIWQRIAAAGFDVIAFDGPGQGGARALGGLTFDHDWEKPVGAVLDHFELDSAGLVGISMGGYWALRAAGREPRIDRVVSWPPVYDWLYRVPERAFAAPHGDVAPAALHALERPHTRPVGPHPRPRRRPGALHRRRTTTRSTSSTGSSA